MKAITAATLFLSTLFVLASLNAFAQGTADTLAGTTGISLDPISLTASLQPARISQTGRNITVISGERFRDLPVHSIDELLRFVPGLEVQMRGPMGSQADIVLRGGTFQQVLILLDGLRINDPNTGHFNAYIPVAPAEIDHIEVLKGASSAIYGSDAVGGVIQVFTKSFVQRSGSDKPSLRAIASVGAGEYNLWHVNTGITYQDRKTVITGGWLSNNTRGRQQRGIRGYVHANTVSLSASTQLHRDWNLAVRSSYDDRDFAAQNYYTSFASDTAAEQVNSRLLQVRLNYTGLEDHRISLDASHKQVRDRYQFNKAGLPNQSTSRMNQVFLRDEWKISIRTGLVSGLQLVTREIESNDRGVHELLQPGAFVLLNQRIGKGLSVNPGLRFDWNKLSGPELVPQLSASYALQSLILRGSAGKTTREADFTERFNNYQRPLVTSGRVGNPDLEAERSFSFELGADLFAARGLKLSTTAFRRNHRRLIDYVVTPYDLMPRKNNLQPGGTYALARNIARVTTQGLELDLLWDTHVLDGKDQLRVMAGLTWLRSETSDTLPSFYLASHARFLTNFNLQYHRGLITVSFNGIYKTRDQQKTDPIQASISTRYFVSNVKLDCKIYRQAVSGFFQLNNIFDQSYSDLLGAPMPGRWFSAGVSASLDLWQR